MEIHRLEPIRSYPLQLNRSCRIARLVGAKSRLDMSEDAVEFAQESPRLEIHYIKPSATFVGGHAIMVCAKNIDIQWVLSSAETGSDHPKIAPSLSAGTPAAWAFFAGPGFYKYTCVYVCVGVYIYIICNSCSLIPSILGLLSLL